MEHFDYFGRGERSKEQARAGKKMRPDPAGDPSSNRRFWRSFLNGNGPTDGRSDGKTNGPTDTTSYKDA